MASGLKSMPPVRIKYYGLIPMTKRTYLMALGSSALFALAAVTAFMMLDVAPPLDTMWSKEHHLPGTDIWVAIRNYMWWIIALGVIAQAIDTAITLRSFAKKEA